MPSSTGKAAASVHDPGGPLVEVVIVAAGSGERLGAAVPKGFVELAGRPLLAYALRRAASLRPRRLALVVPDAGDWMREAGRWAADAGVTVEVVAGGSTRQESVHAGLRALRAAASERGERVADLVLVHDAARPCASEALWRSIVERSAATGAAIPVLPVDDCLKRLDDAGRVARTLERDGLVRVQTPQGFRFDWLWEAHEKATGAGAPDDASLIERLGRPVATVAGEGDNLKVTTGADLPLAEATLRRQGAA